MGHGLTREGLTALSPLVTPTYWESTASPSSAFILTASVYGLVLSTISGLAAYVAVPAGEAPVTGREGRGIGPQLRYAMLISIIFITMRGCCLTASQRLAKVLVPPGRKVPISRDCKGFLIIGNSQTVRLTSRSVERGRRHCGAHYSTRSAASQASQEQDGHSSTVLLSSIRSMKVII